MGYCQGKLYEAQTLSETRRAFHVPLGVIMLYVSVPRMRTQQGLDHSDFKRADSSTKPHTPRASGPAHISRACGIRSVAGVEWQKAIG